MCHSEIFNGIFVEKICFKVYTSLTLFVPKCRCQSFSAPAIQAHNSQIRTVHCEREIHKTRWKLYLSFFFSEFLRMMEGIFLDGDKGHL